MSRAETFKSIRKGVIDFQEQGNEVVEVEKLLKYLDGLEAEMGESEKIDISKEVKLEELRAKFVNQQLEYGWKKDFKLANHLWEKDSSLEMFKSVIASGQNSLKACMLMHAGACIALLAFIGNLASSADTRLFIPQLAGVMLWFVIGVLVVSIAYGATYWTQHCYQHNEAGKWGVRWQVISSVLAIISYLLFFWGSVQGYQAMTAMYVEPIPAVADQLLGDVSPVNVSEVVVQHSTDDPEVKVSDADVLLPTKDPMVELREAVVQLSGDVPQVNVPEVSTVQQEVSLDSLKVVDGELEGIRGSSSE